MTSACPSADAGCLQEKLNREAEERKASGKKTDTADASKPARHADFPPILEGERVWQKNEGKLEFSLEESADGR